VSGFPPEFYLGAAEVTLKWILCRHLIFTMAYQTDSEILRVVQLTLCLCYLHHSEVRQVFFEIASQVPIALSGFLAYVEKKSISENAYWQTTKWSVTRGKRGPTTRWRGRTIDGESGVRYVR
jgi:hypothetical protein